MSIGKAAVVAWVWMAAAPFRIDTKFEAGNAGRMEIVSPNHIRVAVNGEVDQDKRNRQPTWFYFRLDGAAGREVTIELDHLDGEYNYRPHKGAGFRNTIPVYSYDNQTWTHFETSEFDPDVPSLKVRIKPPKDPVWIAWQPPYTTAHLNKLLAEIGRSKFLRREVVGKSVQGRPLLLLTITNPSVPDKNKKVIWLMARQHAWESGTSWVCEGALRFLVSTNPRAARIRDEYIFKVFPIADPDGVVRGGVRYNVYGYDLNRNWDTAEPKHMPEIFAMRKAMLDWLDAGGRMDVFFSLHNTSSADYISGPLTAGGPAVRDLAMRISKLLDTETTFYAPKGPRDESPEPSPKGRQSVYEYLFFQRKVPAFLMELMVDSSPKISRPPTVQDRLEFGAALARILPAAVAGRSE